MPELFSALVNKKRKRPQRKRLQRKRRLIKKRPVLRPAICKNKRRRRQRSSITLVRIQDDPIADEPLTFFSNLKSKWLQFCSWLGIRSVTEKIWLDSPSAKVLQLLQEATVKCDVLFIGLNNDSIRRKIIHNYESLDSVVLDGITPICSSSKDIIIYYFTLAGHNLTQTMKEANRILRKGGVMYVVDQKMSCDSIIKYKNGMLKCGFKRMSYDEYEDNLYFVMKLVKISNFDSSIKIKPFALKTHFFRDFHYSI